MLAVVQGARSGVGLSVVRQLLREGQFRRVVATCRAPEAAAELHQLQKQYDALSISKLDFALPETIASAAAEVKSIHAPVGLVMNTSGFLHDKSRNISPERAWEHLDVAGLEENFRVRVPGY